MLALKCDTGAFAPTVDKAHRLGQLIVAICGRSSRQIAALPAQMERALGYVVGHTVDGA